MSNEETKAKYLPCCTDSLECFGTFSGPGALTELITLRFMLLISCAFSIVPKRLILVVQYVRRSFTLATITGFDGANVKGAS